MMEDPEAKAAEEAERRKAELAKVNAGPKEGGSLGEQTGGAVNWFTPSMRTNADTIRSSKSSFFQGISKRKYSEGEKKRFIEFIYYSTYAFYHVFSKDLGVRESEMSKFFGDYINDLLYMFKSNFSTIVNNSSIYIAIARALAITFHKKLEYAFGIKVDGKEVDGKVDKFAVHAVIDQNKLSSLNQSVAIENQLKEEKIFSTDAFFNLKNKKIRDFIFKTYRNIRDLQNAMDDANLGNRQYKIASRLDYRFTVEILGKKPMQQGMIESHQVRKALSNIFAGNFGMFRNILDDIDKVIDDFDGIDTQKLKMNLQEKLPKIANISKGGMTFLFEEGTIAVGEEEKDLIEQQIAFKEEEVNKLKQKRDKVKSITSAED